MHKDDLHAAWEYQVGPARQVAAMKPKTIPHAVNERSHDHLGLRVPAANAGHADRAAALNPQRSPGAAASSSNDGAYRVSIDELRAAAFRIKQMEQDRNEKERGQGLSGEQDRKS